MTFDAAGLERVSRLLNEKEHPGPWVLATRMIGAKGDLFDVEVYGPFAEHIEAIKFGGEQYAKTGRVWRAIPLEARSIEEGSND